MGKGNGEIEEIRERGMGNREIREMGKEETEKMGIGGNTEYRELEK